MKIYITILMVFLTISSFAQPSGDIERDTALGNQYYSEAFQLYNASETPNDFDTINSLLKKGIILYEKHPFDKKILLLKGLLAYGLSVKSVLDESIEMAQSALNLAQKHELKDSSNLWISYLSLCKTYTYKDRLAAIDYGQKGMKCAEQNMENFLQVAFYTIQIYGQTKYTNQIEPLLDKIETILKDPKNKHLETNWVRYYQQRMRAVSLLTRNHEQAVNYGLKALAENEKYNALNSFELSYLHLDIGLYSGYMRNFNNSIKYIKKGIETTPLKKNEAKLGDFYYCLGQTYIIKKDYEMAIETYEEALRLYRFDSTNYVTQLSLSYFLQGIAYYRLEQYEQAEIKIKRSLSFPSSSNDQIQAYGYLGRTLNKKKQYKASLDTIQKALILISSDFDNKDIYTNPLPYQYSNMFNASLYLADKGTSWYSWGKATKDIAKIEEGLKCLDLGIQLQEFAFQQTKGFDKSRFRINERYLDIFNAQQKAFYAWYEITPTSTVVDDLLQVTERKKAMELMQTLSASNLPENILETEKKIIKKIQEIGQKLDLAKLRNQNDSIQFYQNQLFEATTEMESHLQNIAENYPKAADNFYNSEYANLADIQTKLNKETLLISYNDISMRHQAVNGLIIALSDTTHKIAKVDFAEIQTNIKKLNELIQDRFAFQTSVRNEFIDVSHELYKTLIEPIESELEGKTKLMIVLEGQLFHLPFELLLKSNEKKPYHELDFLIKNYEINYHYSATAFLKLQEKPTVRDNSLLAFAPIFTRGEALTEAARSLDFMIDSLYNGIEGNEFIALPSTKKEVNKIAKIVKTNNGKTNILLSKNATKTNLSQQLESQSYQFVHIATHGLVNFKNPKLSALACYSKNATMDNLIYANEIQFKNINADLVILSSCESGIGQLVEGEGLIALNRSFIYSGAKNVLFSLWKVSDKYSSELMIDFYENYFDNQSYTAALRNAKLKLLENPTTAQPKFWAAFVLMGE